MEFGKQMPSLYKAFTGATLVMALIAPGPADSRQSASPPSDGAALPAREAAVAQSDGPPQNLGEGVMIPPRRNEQLIYVSDPTNSEIQVYDLQTAQLQGTLVDGLDNPEGLFVDAKHHLWVANAALGSGRGTVAEFALGSTLPIKILSDPNEYAQDVSVCPNGWVYVANYGSSLSGAASISVYASGATTPTGLLTYPEVTQMDYITCDAKGNVFVTVQTSGAGGVVAYAGGKQAGAALLPIHLVQPGGIKPDNAGNLLVDDPVAHTVTEYTEAGIATGRQMYTGDSSDWLDIAVSRDGDVVAGADATSNYGVALSFPSATPLRMYFGLGAAVGVALDPGQPGI